MLYIDKSGSMEGIPIKAMNKTLNNMLPDLKKNEMFDEVYFNFYSSSDYNYYNKR